MTIVLNGMFNLDTTVVAVARHRHGQQRVVFNGQLFKSFSHWKIGVKFEIRNSESSALILQHCHCHHCHVMNASRIQVSLQILLDICYVVYACNEVRTTN